MMDGTSFAEVVSTLTVEIIGKAVKRRHNGMYGSHSNDASII